MKALNQQEKKEKTKRADVIAKHVSADELKEPMVTVQREDSQHTDRHRIHEFEPEILVWCLKSAKSQLYLNATPVRGASFAVLAKLLS